MLSLAPIPHKGNVTGMHNSIHWKAGGWTWSARRKCEDWAMSKNILCWGPLLPWSCGKVCRPLDSFHQMKEKGRPSNSSRTEICSICTQTAPNFNKREQSTATHTTHMNFMNRAEGKLSKHATCCEIYRKCVVGKMRMSDILLISFCGKSVKGVHIYKTLPSCTFDTYAFL